MTEHDGRRWVIVGALFATLFLIWGPLNAGGVFFLPVITHFGWSRGFFSLLLGVGPLAAGVSSPAAGWLMDRIDAQGDDRGRIDGRAWLRRPQPREFCA